MGSIPITRSIPRQRQASRGQQRRRQDPDRMGKFRGTAHGLSRGSSPPFASYCPGIRTQRRTWPSSHIPSANQRLQAPSLNSSQSNALQSATGRHFRCRPGAAIPWC